MTVPRLGDIPLSEVDRLVSDAPVPVRAWRIAGIERDPSAQTLEQCTVEQLEAFALMSVETSEGVCFRTRAMQLLERLYLWAGQDPAPMRTRYTEAHAGRRASRDDHPLIGSTTAPERPRLVIGSRDKPKRVLV